MDLERFRATGRDVIDLGAELPGMDLDGTPGRVYLGNGGVYIERWEDDRHGVAPPNGPTWLLTLGRDQYDGDLETLEPLLFNWCRDERFWDEFETVKPEDLQPQDVVKGNGALWRILDFTQAGRTEMVNVECVDPQGVSPFTRGFRKQFVRVPRDGTWERRL